MYYTFCTFPQKLPLSQKPEVFGMHANVDISRELQETRNLCDAVLLTQDQAGGGGDGKFDAALSDIATDILSKVSTTGFRAVE
jgi:dynein heavy chain